MPSTSTMRDEDKDDDALAREALNMPEDFGDLYRRYVRPVYRYIFWRVGSEWHAEDLTQDVFVRAIVSLHRYRGGGFRVWLFGIARHVVLDWLRRNHPEPIDPEVLEKLLASNPDLVLLVLDRERLRKIPPALNMITPARAEALALTKIGGLTIAETAQIMGKSKAAVKMLISRGRADLKRVLDSESRRPNGGSQK